MSRELSDAGLPVVNILGAVYEIFQVLILSRAPVAPTISVSFKNKGQTCHTGLHLFCLKVSCSGSVPVRTLIEENCFPQLCKIVSEMQTREPESHLAFQLVNENNSGLQKTMLLRLEANTASCMTVNILSETVTTANNMDDSSTVLELRTLVTISHAIQCGKEILDLLQRIKLLNPKVQILFSLFSLTLVEFDLCDTQSISCETFDIYSGPDLFLGKHTPHFICQEMRAKCSRKFEFPNTGDVTGTVYLKCIACLVPISTAQNVHTGEDGFRYDCHQQQEIRGHIRIQLYGPASLPFDMKVITNKLPLSPHSLLPWQRLGLQVKKSFSCSSYDLHCSAKISNRECIPSWATQCQHFCIVLAFILNESEDFTEDNIFYRLYKHQESFRDLEQQTLNREMYSTFQQAAWCCLEDLLSQDKQKSMPVKYKGKNSTGCQVDDSELFKQMIPDVANSLTDIFIRSTCMDFRSQVGALVPTSSRSSLSSHLEKSLWKVIYKSRKNSDNPAIADQTIINPKESQVDDWDFSEDSLFSNEHFGALSPDSLDLDWDNEQPTADCEDNARNSGTTLLTSDIGCNIHEIHDSTHEDGPSSFQQITSLPKQFDSYLNPEQELDQWEIPRDFLKSAPAETHTSNTDSKNNIPPPVYQQVTAHYQPFHSVPCAEELPFSLRTRLELASSSSLTCQTTETGANTGPTPASCNVDKLPRKRSSEYIDVNLPHDFSCDDVKKAEDLTDSKKQRCQNYDSTRGHNLSLQKVPSAFCLDEQDSFVTSKSGLKEVEYSNEEINLKHSSQAEDDTLSSCWFDEDEIANWHAELDN